MTAGQWPSMLQGNAGDFARVAAADPQGFQSSSRQKLLRERLAQGDVLLAQSDAGVGGFAIRGRFFGYDFLELLFVAPAHRRQGLGAALVADFEARRRSGRVFVSTNRSNGPMHALLGGAGYSRSGEIFNLDPGDPEVFYVKRFDGAPVET